MKKVIALLLVVILVLGAVSCASNKNNGETTTNKTENTTNDSATTAVDTEKKEEVKVLSYEEFLAAEVDTTVTFDAYIQFACYAQAWSNINLYLADENGAYFVYRMPCTDDDAAKLTVGTKVRITGDKAEWKGEVEIKEGTAKYEVLEGNYVAEAKEMTDTSSEALMAVNNQYVTLKDCEILASSYDSDGDGNNDAEAAFLYKYNNSGEKGDDLYLTVKTGENTYTFLVESDYCNAESDVYKAVEALNIGDKVDLTGFLYIYNTPQLQVFAVTVK